jgi:hypothetical protein
LAAFAGALPILTDAQDPFPTPTPAPNPLAGVPVQVLDQQEVTIGTHTITYNRIAPPVFPAATPTTIAPVTTAPTETARRASLPVTVRPRPASPAGSRKKTPSTQTKGDTDNGDASRFQMLFLSATVYDHQFTAVHWCDGTAPGLLAYLDLDFSYFGPVTTVESADTVYDLVFGLGNDTASSLSLAGQPLPDFSGVPAGQSGYQIVAGDPNAYPDAIAALNALCAYYDANSAQMIAAYDQQQAANAAQLQWLQTHPPVTPNTVVNFWPVKSSVYPTSSH